MKLAALHLGARAIRMIVVDAARDGSWELVESAEHDVRLGEGTLRTGWIRDEKADAAIRSVRTLARLARAHRVGRILAVATSPLREAVNGGDLLERLAHESGIRARILRGDEEAWLVWLAARHGRMLNGRPSLILDIGGGCASLVVATGDDLRFARTLPIGSLRLRELFVAGPSISRGDHRRIHLHLRDALEATLNDMGPGDVDRAVGLSRAFGPLAASIASRQGRPQPGSPHGTTFDLPDLAELHESPAGRTPGACVATEILGALGVETLTVCDLGIAEAFVTDHLQPRRRASSLRFCTI